MSIIASIEIKNLKQLFHIENGNSESSQQVLSLRLGDKHTSFAITSKSGAELYQLAYCVLDEQNEKELSVFFAAYPSLSNSFYEIQVTYDFSQSVLISSKEYKLDDAALLLSTVGGNIGNANIISELIAEWQLYNIYAVPKEMQAQLLQKFPAARCRHHYSLAIKNLNASNEGGILTVDLGKDNFTLIAANGGKFLLAQTFDYTTPEDVLFYLLKASQQFSLSQQQVRLQLSGLIDKQSSLYNELHQYFKNVEFREANWNIESEYPAHFFTSLNDLAKCAS